MNKFLYILSIVIAGFITFSTSSCVKQNFDEPPSGDYPELETNATIADIKALHKPGEFVKIEEELIFSAVVVANDSSGNYFKALIIQDETGGIELSVNAVNLFNQFPVGRKIFINSKGLVLNDYNGLIQLGGNTYEDRGEERLGGIEEVLINKYIVRGAPGQKVTAKRVSSYKDLTDADQSTLVILENTQFIDAHVGRTYADAVNNMTVNLTMENCDKEEITLRTSGYADFAGVEVPAGNGDVIGIYSIFGATQQFYVRSPQDVKMTGTRCDGSGGGGGECGFDEELITIKDVRDAYQGAPTKAPKDKMIRGVVISDKNQENTHGQNLVIQDDSGYGIMVRFGAEHKYNLGDEVEIVVHEADLSEYQGLLQLDNVNPAKSCSPGKGTEPDPVVLTVKELIDNLDRYESTLIKIKDVNLSGAGGKYNGGVTVKDGTGTIEMFTRSYAKFANDSYPTGTVDLTAMVSRFNNPQLIIRNKNDVVVTGGGGGNDDLVELPFFEGFENGIPSNWTETRTKGDRVWEARDYGGDHYVQMGAFASGNILDVEAWLITPKLNFESQSDKTIEILLADAFENGNPLKVMYSTDYEGGNPTAATWTEIGRSQIDPLINNPDTYDNNYESSGKIDLSMVTKNGHIAFLYESGGTVSTTIQLFSVEVE